MKILMTGGNGFLGLNICHYLDVDACPGNPDPNEVTILDPSECPKGYLYSFWQTCHDQIGIKFLKGDICDSRKVQELAEQADVIMHLAFVVGGPACDKNPKQAKRIAAEGMENVIQAAKGKMLIFPSSDVVYGKDATGLCDETTPCHPATLYGQLKLEAERMIKEGCDKFCILRLPSTFGTSAAMRWDCLVNFFYKELCMKHQIEIRDPETSRTLLHTWDAARAFQFVLDNQDQCAGKTFNVASGVWTKREIAQTIINRIGGRIEEGGSYQDLDPRAFELDCSAIRALGWEPKFDLTDGVECLAVNYPREKL